MGQENDTIRFEEVDEANIKKGKRDKIFKKSYTVKKIKDEIAELQNFNDPITNESNEEIKICSNCYNKGRNFRKHPELSYTGIHRRQPPPKATYSRGHYQESEPVEESHEVYYYNAWSLPIQKCYIEKVQKAMTQTHVTEEVPKKEVYQHYDKRPIHEYEPIRESKPPRFQEASVVENYDYSKVRTDNRMQNLFLYDEK